MFGGASIEVSKQLVEVPIYGLSEILDPQTGYPFYYFASSCQDLEARPDQIFTQNGTIWRAIIYSELRRTDQVIRLESFYLFEWFPRCPGLYFTEHARWARESAQQFIITTADGDVVYSPMGKQSMLDGGIGCVRLLPIKIDGEKYYLMSASSNGRSDQGFPVAVPQYIFNGQIDSIRKNGANFVNIVGKLIEVPESINGVFSNYRGVPKLLLKVDAISSANHQQSSNEGLIVNVAVSFQGTFQDKVGIYASYVSFDPSSKSRDSFAARKIWLEEAYISGLYKGKIITDFDQTVEHFNSAPFSLNKVMNFNLRPNDFQRYLFANDANHYLNQQIQLSVYYQQINIEKMENNQNVNVSGGQVGFIANDVTSVGDLTFNNENKENQIDLLKLAEELAKLRIEAKNTSVTRDNDEEVGIIAAAESAALNGDKPKVIELFKKLGTWSLDVATKIGVGLVVAIIKEHAIH